MSLKRYWWYQLLFDSNFDFFLFFQSFFIKNLLQKSRKDYLVLNICYMSHCLQLHPLILLFVFELVPLICLKNKIKKNITKFTKPKKFWSRLLPEPDLFRSRLLPEPDVFWSRLLLETDVLWGKFISIFKKYLRVNKFLKLNNVSNIK